MRPGARVAHCLWLGWVLLGCSHAPYPPPRPSAQAPLKPRGRAPVDAGDAAGLREQVRACEARTSERTVREALGVLERLRDALGPSCVLDTMGGEPLRLRGRCPGHGGLEPGALTLAPSPVRCAAAAPARAMSEARCAGIMLAEALRAGGTGVWARVELVVVGQATPDEPRPQSFAGCAEALQRLRGRAGPGAGQSEATGGVEAPGPDADQEPFALCRAASFADELGAGIAARAPAPADLDGRIDLGLLGATLALPPEAERGDAAAESRPALELALQLVPASDTDVPGSCVSDRAQGHELLQCLERCTRQLALARGASAMRSGAALPSLFVRAHADVPPEPARGLGVHGLGAPGELPMDRTQLCATLGGGSAVCAADVQNLGASGAP